MQWLDQHTYQYDYPHTPLARIAIALGPYVDGLRSRGERLCYDEGNAILHSNGDYDRNLTLARLGTLPFFVLASALVFIVGAKLYGKPAGLVATLLFTSLPTVLAHASLATTDMAAAASLTGVVFAFLLWLERPNRWQGLGLGVAGSVAILSRLSALLFFPASVLPSIGLYVYAERSKGARFPEMLRRRLPSLALACGIVFLLIWAAYFFSVSPTLAPGKLDRPEIIGLSHTAKTLMQIPIPAGELVRGIGYVLRHGHKGHNTYFLGEVRSTGWWYFFPIVLGVKTPLAFLILFFIGIPALWRSTGRDKAWKHLAPLLAAVCILLVSLPSSLNLGVRYILPIYPMMALVAGSGAIALFHLKLKRRLGSLLAMALLVWLSVSSLKVHPDYLAYFNEVAMREPERIVVDSDLDWGQDLKRLTWKLKELGVEEVYLEYFGTAVLRRHPLPKVLKIDPQHPPKGWVVVSLMHLKRRSDKFAWLEGYEPVAMAGKSIRIYRIP
jgi:4-amino-4-deoxy-L-arabinose transferase-like glycosyltransferase